MTSRHLRVIDALANRDPFQAMSALHGAEIYGVRLKVLEAEEQRSKNDD